MMGPWEANGLVVLESADSLTYAPEVGPPITVAQHPRAGCANLTVTSPPGLLGSAG